MTKREQRIIAYANEIGHFPTRQQATAIDDCYKSLTTQLELREETVNADAVLTQSIERVMGTRRAELPALREQNEREEKGAMQDAINEMCRRARERKIA